MIVSVICDKHGVTEGYRSGSRQRCKKCNVIAASKRRKALKLLALEYKGGKCEVCGYNRCKRALEFHHRDPSQKDFAIGSDGLTRSFERIKAELDKCVLLCANCHREEHDRLLKED